jgi:hypothetical protein
MYYCVEKTVNGTQRATVIGYDSMLLTNGNISGNTPVISVVDAAPAQDLLIELTRDSKVSLTKNDKEQNTITFVVEPGVEFSDLTKEYLTIKNLYPLEIKSTETGAGYKKILGDRITKVTNNFPNIIKGAVDDVVSAITGKINELDDSVHDLVEKVNAGEQLTTEEQEKLNNVELLKNEEMNRRKAYEDFNEEQRVGYGQGVLQDLTKDQNINLYDGLEKVLEERAKKATDSVNECNKLKKAIEDYDNGTDFESIISLAKICAIKNYNESLSETEEDKEIAEQENMFFSDRTKDILSGELIDWAIKIFSAYNYSNDKVKSILACLLNQLAIDYDCDNIDISTENDGIFLYETEKELKEFIKGNSSTVTMHMDTEDSLVMVRIPKATSPTFYNELPNLLGFADVYGKNPNPLYFSCAYKTDPSAVPERDYERIEGYADKNDLPIQDNEKDYFDKLKKFTYKRLSIERGVNQEQFEGVRLSLQMEEYFKDLIGCVIGLNWSHNICVPKNDYIKSMRLTGKSVADLSEDEIADKDEDEATDSIVSKYVYETIPGMSEGAMNALMAERPISHLGIQLFQFIKTAADMTNNVDIWFEAIIKLLRWGSRKPKCLSFEGYNKIYDLTTNDIYEKTGNVEDYVLGEWQDSFGNTVNFRPCMFVMDSTDIQDDALKAKLSGMSMLPIPVALVGMISLVNESQNKKEDLQISVSLVDAVMSLINDNYKVFGDKSLKIEGVKLEGDRVIVDPEVSKFIMEGTINNDNNPNKVVASDLINAESSGRSTSLLYPFIKSDCFDFIYSRLKVSNGSNLNIKDHSQIHIISQFLGEGGSYISLDQMLENYKISSEEDLRQKISDGIIMPQDKAKVVDANIFSEVFPVFVEATNSLLVKLQNEDSETMEDSNGSYFTSKVYFNEILNAIKIVGYESEDAFLNGKSISNKVEEVKDEAPSPQVMNSFGGTQEEPVAEEKKSEVVAEQRTPSAAESIHVEKEVVQESSGKSINDLLIAKYKQDRPEAFRITKGSNTAGWVVQDSNGFTVYGMSAEDDGRIKHDENRVVGLDEITIKINLTLASIVMKGEQPNKALRFATEQDFYEFQERASKIIKTVKVHTDQLKDAFEKINSNAQRTGECKIKLETAEKINKIIKSL